METLANKGTNNKKNSKKKKQEGTTMEHREKETK